MSALRAISFDFGNTLCAVSDEALRTVTLDAAERIAARSGPFALEDFVSAWREEARRQFALNMPLGRENDLGERLVRVLARLRGMAPPAPPPSPPALGEGAAKRDTSPVAAWDDGAAARLSGPGEVEAGVRDYGEAFVASMPVDERVGPLLSRLFGRYRLAILSNWPLAWAIDSIAERAGWTPYLGTIVVSQRVGWIKPDRRMFEATADALDVPMAELLHVGDDWAADIVGAKRAGARAAYLDARPAASPLPSSAPDGSVKADLVLHDLADIEGFLPGLGGVGA
jgi:FMN phosphatase YigB (HAD superfamily)